MNKSSLYWQMLTGLWLTTAALHAQPQPAPMLRSTPAPDFQTEDVNHRSVSLQAYRGQYVLLSFMRNAGCPVCNLWVHQLRQQADTLRHANVAVVLIYDSTPENMRRYLEQAEPLPFTFVADPNHDLYALYNVGGGMGKMMKGMFHGAMGKMKQGKRLFRSPIRQDGRMTTIGADFLIDPQGQLLTAHPGRYLGDHLTVGQILQAVRPLTAVR